MIYPRYISELYVVFYFHERLTKEDVFVIKFRSSYRIKEIEHHLLAHMLGYNTPPFTGSHTGNRGDGL